MYTLIKDWIGSTLTPLQYPGCGRLLSVLGCEKIWLARTKLEQSTLNSQNSLPSASQFSCRRETRVRIPNSLGVVGSKSNMRLLTHPPSRSEGRPSR